MLGPSIARSVVLRSPSTLPVKLQPMAENSRIVHTIGHSTRPIEDFLALLSEHRIEALADVRRYPGSRRHPQFAQDALRDALGAAGIEYLWFPELGGRRAPRKDSRNTAWRNDGFRGYADYMETPEFDAALARLCNVMAACRTVTMCAEQAWQQCHRGLISDALKARGVEVIHILGAGRTQVHPYTEPAHIVDGALSYAPAGAQGRLDF